MLKVVLTSFFYYISRTRTAYRLAPWSTRLLYLCFISNPKNSLRSEGSLNLEMLNLARISKYVDNTSVLSINKTEETAKTERTHQIQ